MLNIATALYPNYHINNNYISDLGATCRSTCTIQRPSSIIFNSSVILSGVLGLGSFLLLRKDKRIFAYWGILSSLGAMGVGIFTEEYTTLHPNIALLAFGSGALTAISLQRYVRFPFNLISVLMGIAGLAFLGLLGLYLFLNSGNPDPQTAQTILGLRFGGLEWLLAYTIILWELGFGAYLMKAPLDNLADAH